MKYVKTHTLTFTHAELVQLSKVIGMVWHDSEVAMKDDVMSSEQMADMLAIHTMAADLSLLINREAER